ncbi:hypothetical protein CDAR_270771 [Caerostris darwini]|uniref:Uncharacterized protein n=1 Tax=Caerostris darwini TaxID=1538125 RepID=A0AAV4TFI2_9ARAC|nr:hypothetical protein CDAR_270771 [Caerostris darwini]
MVPANESPLSPTLGRRQEMISLAVESIRLCRAIGGESRLLPRIAIGCEEKSLSVASHFRARITPSVQHGRALIKVSSLIGFCLLKQIRVYYAASQLHISTINLAGIVNGLLRGLRLPRREPTPTTSSTTGGRQARNLLRQCCPIGPTDARSLQLAFFLQRAVGSRILEVTSRDVHSSFVESWILSQSI